MTLLERISKEFGSFEQFYENYEDILRSGFRKRVRCGLYSPCYDDGLSLGFIKAAERVLTDTQMEETVDDLFLYDMVGQYQYFRRQELRHKYAFRTNAPQTERFSKDYDNGLVESTLQDIKDQITSLEYAVAEKFFSYEWDRKTIAKEFKIDYRRVSAIINKLRKLV